MKLTVKQLRKLINEGTMPSTSLQRRYMNMIDYVAKETNDFETLKSVTGPFAGKRKAENIISSILMTKFSHEDVVRLLELLDEEDMRFMLNYVLKKYPHVAESKSTRGTLFNEAPQSAQQMWGLMSDIIDFLAEETDGFQHLGGVSSYAKYVLDEFKLSEEDIIKLAHAFNPDGSSLKMIDQYVSGLTDRAPDVENNYDRLWWYGADAARATSFITSVIRKLYEKYSTEDKIWYARKLAPL